MEIDNTVKLLWDCASLLNTETHTKKLLKSYYINTCRKIVKSKEPLECFGVSQMCPRCSCPWSENQFKLQLKPQRVANNAKARKLINKLDEAKANNTKCLLTKSQRKRAKWLKKRIVSNMQIKCEFCQKKTNVPLEKPKLKQKPLSTAQELAAPEPMVKNKKKKKSKNRTAGLKINMTQKPCVQTIMDKPKPTPPTKQITASTTLHKKPLQSKQNTAMPPANTLKKVTNKQKKEKQQPQKVATNMPKVKSKTQQQNALLQLAALLKTQTTKTATNTSQNRLESLLKQNK